MIPKWIIWQNLPEVTEQKGPETRIRCLRHPESSQEEKMEMLEKYTAWNLIACFLFLSPSLSLCHSLSPTSPLPGRAVVTVTTVPFIRGSKRVEKPGVNKAHLFALRGKTRDRYARLELRRQLEQWTPVEFHLHLLGRVDVGQMWGTPMNNQFGDKTAVMLMRARCVPTFIPFSS